MELEKKDDDTQTVIHETTVVDAMTGEEQNSPSDIKALRKAAKEAKELMNSALGAYWNLCVVIREKQISPSVLSRELRSLEYSKFTIAEIKRVAFTTNEIFEEYKTRQIGFKVALGKARDADVTLERRKQKEVVRFAQEFQRFLEKYLPVTGSAPEYLKSGYLTSANFWNVMMSVSRPNKKKSKTKVAK